ncbi:MAG: SRPBCC family protein [Verrucomicrobiota bacterium]
MPRFRYSSILPAGLQTVYDFHSDTNNLALAQPWWAPVSKIIQDGPHQVGSKIEIHTGGPVKQRWLVRITEMVPPAKDAQKAWTIDEAEEGPFPVWKHQHLFETEKSGTKLSDCIQFQPPLGWFGWLLLPGIYLTFYLMFRARHQRTYSHFSSS